MAAPLVCERGALPARATGPEPESKPLSSSPAATTPAAPAADPKVKTQSADAAPAEKSAAILRRTPREIERWEQHTRKSPEDAEGWVKLAEARLQRARETNDPAFYTRTETALANAQKLEPDQYRAMSLRAQLHSARHQFDTAIEWLGKAVKANPSDPLNYGLLGDIYAELGQYEKAEENYQKMMDLRPGRAAYSRASYLMELYGEEPYARTLMTRAIMAGSPRGEDAAWCYVHLGHLNFNAGFLPAAQKAYEAALASFPDYSAAYAGMAKVKAAQKEYPAAIGLYQKALKSGPHHEIYAALIELYTLSGQAAKAKAMRSELGVLQEKYSKNDMDIDFEVAEIDAEQGQNLAHALKLAKEEVQTHGNVKAYDALAWIAYLNDDLATAQSAMEKAMSLGTRSPVMLYHAARIQEKLGKSQESLKLYNRAISMCPYFHVRYAADARSRVERITKGLYDDSAAQVSQKPAPETPHPLPEKK
ncbi:MAG: tetratricopeptide repeat protein [Armatimonadetes bacterium]|nr:tetratricopeptide repeat protein [Armatimonadota bacterium]